MSQNYAAPKVSEDGRYYWSGSKWEPFGFTQQQKSVFNGIVIALLWVLIASIFVSIGVMVNNQLTGNGRSETSQSRLTS